MHPKSVPSTFLLGVVLPQEFTMETTDSPDKQIVGANGIPSPKKMYEFSPGTSSTSLEAGLVPNRLFLDVSRQSRWILK
jgi:hypothetical protein